MVDVRLFALIVALVLSYFNPTAASQRANDNFKTPLSGSTVLEDSFRKEFLTKCSSKVQQRIPVTEETRRHAIKTHTKRRYLKGKVAYYFNSNATFNVEIIRAGDVELNPGDIRNPCSVCGKSVARTHRALDCSTCKLQSHIRCSSITPTLYCELLARENYYWECSSCLWKSALGSLPFNGIDDTEFLQEIQCRSQIEDDNDEYLQDLVHKLATNAKHLKIAHLSVRG